MPLAARRVLLGDLVAAVSDARLVRGDPWLPIAGITHDSRLVRPGWLFVAVPGRQQDGARFIADAVMHGASAVVAQSPVDGTPPYVAVPNARAALADFACAFYGHPSRQLRVVGITGTDGKTSTTHLLSGILEAHGISTGWLTTVNTKIGRDLRSNAVEHTTPEAPVVQQILAEMVEARVEVAILETSSHALELDRVRGTAFDVGLFTNLSPEHLNFHGTLEAYAAAKARLFERLPTDGLAVLNADDPWSETMRAATRARVVNFALECEADVRATDIRLSPRGTSFSVQPGDVAVRSRLIGRFNVANWLAAYAAARHFGAGRADLSRAASQQEPVPGRMNLVDAGQPFAVVVDFAHTPQALEKAIGTLRELGARRVLLVFGLAGGRDAANRPVMGALAARTTDFFLISSDDPGDEDPSAIAHQIAQGVPPGTAFDIELDRRMAIRRLFERARPGDAVLLAGKGHERRMVVGDQRLPWNDAQAAAEALAELGLATQPVP